jgi:hypothetical protein
MAFNFMGFPIGAAIAGALVSVSMEATIWFGVVACVVAAVAAAVLVPAQEPVQSWSLAAEPVDPRASAKLADPPEAG